MPRTDACGRGLSLMVPLRRFHYSSVPGGTQPVAAVTAPKLVFLKGMRGTEPGSLQRNCRPRLEGEVTCVVGAYPGRPGTSSHVLYLAGHVAQGYRYLLPRHCQLGYAGFGKRDLAAVAVLSTALGLVAYTTIDSTPLPSHCQDFIG